MEKQPANALWLQNNNNSPQRQQNQLRPGPNGRPNGQPNPKGISPLNRWLLVIVLMMLGIFLFQIFNNNSSSNTPQHAELKYSELYNQIKQGNVKSVTITGTTDITGTFCQPVKNFNDFHVYNCQMGIPILFQYSLTLRTKITKNPLVQIPQSLLLRQPRIIVSG